jgi:hypothetical protein
MNAPSLGLEDRPFAVRGQRIRTASPVSTSSSLNKTIVAAQRISSHFYKMVLCSGFAGVRFATQDMGFYELRRQLGYKAAWRGGHVVAIDRWYPSSKTCSCCGHRLEELELGTRSWICPACGVRHDRDVNAAVNLKNMAMSSIATACGGNGSGPVREHGAKPVPVKQEPSGKS